jgi:hypothetical protein
MLSVDKVLPEESKLFLKKELRTKSAMEVLIDSYLRPFKLDLSCLNNEQILKQKFSPAQIASIAYLLNILYQNNQIDNLLICSLIHP